MTDRSDRPRDQVSSEVPGLSMVDSWMQAYGRAWNRHVRTMGDIWEDLSREDLNASSWTRSYSKLMQACVTSAQELFGVYTQQTYGPYASAPTVAFVLDKSAQASAQPRALALPQGVVASSLRATPLPVDSSGALIATVQLTPTNSGLDVSIAGVSSEDKTGRQFISLIYRPTASAGPLGSAPPPSEVFGLVVVAFV